MFQNKTRYKIWNTDKASSVFAVVEDDKGADDADADDDVRDREEEEEEEGWWGWCKRGVSSSTGSVPRGVRNHIDGDGDDDSWVFRSSYSPTSLSFPFSPRSFSSTSSSPSTGIHFMFEARFCCISPV